MTRKEIIEALREKLRKRGLTKHVPAEAILSCVKIIIEIIKELKGKNDGN